MEMKRRSEEATKAYREGVLATYTEVIDLVENMAGDEGRDYFLKKIYARREMLAKSAEINSEATSKNIAYRTTGHYEFQDGKGSREMVREPLTHEERIESDNRERAKHESAKRIEEYERKERERYDREGLAAINARTERLEKEMFDSEIRFPEKASTERVQVQRGDKITVNVESQDNEYTQEALAREIRSALNREAVFQSERERIDSLTERFICAMISGTGPRENTRRDELRIIDRAFELAAIFISSSNLEHERRCKARDSKSSD